MHFYRLFIIFVLTLLSLAVVPLCYSSTLIDRHHSDVHKVRVETVIPVGWPDFLNIEQLTDVHFWKTHFQRAGTACPVSENLQWQLSCLKLFLERTALNTHHAGGLKAGNGDGAPSGSQTDKGASNKNNHHQKEQRFEPDGQETRSPGEDYEDREGGDNRKDDNGVESEKDVTTQGLQALANQLIAIIESGDPDAVFKLRQILDELDMPQRLQVLETIGTNTRGNPVTPLEVALDLQRSFYENSERNRFIKQLIEATTDKTRTLNDPDMLSALRPIIPPDRPLPKAGDNNLKILYKIVKDIINRLNQSDHQPPIGEFEKCCFTEYFVQLFLLYSNPLESIRKLLEKISDSVISRDIMIHASSFTFSVSFRDTFIQFEQHPSFHELERLSNQLMRQSRTSHSVREHSLQLPLVEPVISHSDNSSNDTTASNRYRFTDSIQPVNSYRSPSVSVANDFPSHRYLQQGARPKRTVLANQQNVSSQKRLKARPSYGDHQANKAHNRSDLEVSGINQNFLSKYSTDGSLLIELKRRAQEKEEKKRQQIEALTEEVQGLRIENRELTIETQGLRMENRELDGMNQDLMAESLKHWNSVAHLEAQNQCLREHIEKLYVDLKKQEELADYWSHQTASNLAYQTREANNPAMHSHDTAHFASHQLLGTQNEEANPSNEPLRISEQEAREPLCNHYHRLCRVNFECCARYFPCHRCHNESDDCDVKNRKAFEARKLQCSLCNYEGDITENSQTCPGCNQQMSEYFCAKCKHFICVEKNPHHCDKCGFCRVEKDKSFHCDTCNVCMDKKYQDNHKCRENSGHDECCICLEDTFNGCLMMPCSHKFHRDCAIAMIKNGIKTCPVCRHPLYTPLDGNDN
ncbi:CHY zinc finger protein [Endozoicomonas sp. ISHI1]|uniref:CHY zinc finger protein n=1 Tax=Endozoicomonas sp. ISHI1 TaxID=2825882 RepID=UPI002147D57C|nr:CHY zinc finger protein [Endozoicomonas sp. ISHI1]